MERFVLTGYRYFEFTDNKNNVIKGYTLFLLQSVNHNSGKGYMPVQFYDRYNNKPKFPSISVELFEKFQVMNFKLNQQVEVLFDRYNHLLEIKQ